MPPPTAAAKRVRKGRPGRAATRSAFCKPTCDTVSLGECDGGKGGGVKEVWRRCSS